MVQFEAKYLPQIAPEAVSEHEYVKNFLGGMPPDPPRGVRIFVSIFLDLLLCNPPKPKCLDPPLQRWEVELLRIRMPAASGPANYIYIYCRLVYAWQSTVANSAYTTYQGCISEEREKRSIIKSNSNELLFDIHEVGPQPVIYTLFQVQHMKMHIARMYSSLFLCLGVCHSGLFPLKHKSNR